MAHTIASIHVCIRHFRRAMNNRVNGWRNVCLVCLSVLIFNVIFQNFEGRSWAVLATTPRPSQHAPFPARIHPHIAPPRILMMHTRSSTTPERCHSERFVHRRGAVGGVIYTVWTFLCAPVHHLSLPTEHPQRDASTGTNARRCFDSGRCGVGPFAEEQLYFRP
jgi:hypothetical protein